MNKILFIRNCQHLLHLALIFLIEMITADMSFFQFRHQLDICVSDPSKNIWIRIILINFETWSCLCRLKWSIAGGSGKGGRYWMDDGYDRIITLTLIGESVNWLNIHCKIVTEGQLGLFWNWKLVWWPTCSLSDQCNGLHLQENSNSNL